jgi:hypothetical protein
MIGTFDILADGEGGRASTVGWIILALAIGAGLFIAIIAISLGVETFFDRLAQMAPPSSPARWSMLVGGLALVAVGFIFQSWGLAILGGISVFCFWRIVERNIV